MKCRFACTTKWEWKGLAHLSMTPCLVLPFGLRPKHENRRLTRRCLTPETLDAGPIRIHARLLLHDWRLRVLSQISLNRSQTDNRRPQRLFLTTRLVPFRAIEGCQGGSEDHPGVGHIQYPESAPRLVLPD